MASNMRKQRLSIHLHDIRGVQLGLLLANGGRLFARGGAAAREDPAGTYALSESVQALDYFVSHAWRARRLTKYLALLCYFNLDAAVVAHLVVCCACFLFGTFFFESLPAYFVLPPQPAWIDDAPLRTLNCAQFFAPLAFAIVLFFGHHLFRRGEHVFLDICCINQLDNEKKAAGINSLGALLDRSRRMVVLLDEHTMKRMWCVFEVASFATRASIDRMDLVPLHLALQQGALVVFILFVWLLMQFSQNLVNL
jgi:hypothetical protein